MRITDAKLLALMEQTHLSTRISDLPGFPWSMLSFQDLIIMINNNQIQAAVIYTPDFRYEVMNKRELQFINIFSNFFILIPVAFIVLAIWMKNWIFLFGIPQTLIAAFISNPWARNLKQIILLGSIAILLVSFNNGNYVLSILVGGQLLSILLTVFSRNFINQILLTEIKKSELLFCYTFQNGILLLKDIKSGKTYRI